MHDVSFRKFGPGGSIYGIGFGATVQVVHWVKRPPAISVLLDRIPFTPKFRQLLVRLRSRTTNCFPVLPVHFRLDMLTLRECPSEKWLHEYFALQYVPESRCKSAMIQVVPGDLSNLISLKVFHIFRHILSVQSVFWAQCWNLAVSRSCSSFTHWPRCWFRTGFEGLGGSSTVWPAKFWYDDGELWITLGKQGGTFASIGGHNR
jgi:hypothetical protein